MKIRWKNVEALFRWTSDLCFELHTSKSLVAFRTGPLLNTNLLWSNLFPYHNISRLTMVVISVQQRTYVNHDVISDHKLGRVRNNLGRTKSQFGSIYSITYNDLFDLLVRNSKFPFSVISESLLFTIKIFSFGQVRAITEGIIWCLSCRHIDYLIANKSRLQ